MNRLLYIIAPAATYIEDGTIETVQLSCIDENGKQLPAVVSRVLLRITDTDPLTFEEIPSLAEGQVFGVNEDDSIIIYATKIVDPCTDEVTYVKDYFTDVAPFTQCCSLAEQQNEIPTDETPPPPNGDPVENKVLLQVNNETTDGTFATCTIQLNAIQTVSINWGDGFITNLSNGATYNFTHLYNAPGIYNAQVSFSNQNNVVKLKFNSMHVQSMSSLINFINLTELEMVDNLLSALPGLPTGLLKLIVTANLIDTFSALPSALQYLDCADNLADTISMPSTVTTLICGSSILENFVSLHSGLLTFSCSNSPNIDTIPALPSSLLQLECENCDITNLPTLPADLNTLLAAGNTLSVATVNTALTTLAAGIVNDGLLDLSDQVPTATPTGGGATAKTTLISRSWDVTTD